MFHLRIEQHQPTRVKSNANVSNNENRKESTSAKSGYQTVYYVNYLCTILKITSHSGCLLDLSWAVSRTSYQLFLIFLTFIFILVRCGSSLVAGHYFSDINGL